MSDSIKALILGIIEGLTEFIPVSSTGHLILAGEWLNFSSGNNGTFEIAIQLGAILAVLVIYKDFFKTLITPNQYQKSNLINIALAILPAFIAGFLFYSSIKAMFNTQTVILMLAVGSIIMLIVEHWIKPSPKTHSLETITPSTALKIGLAQCAALIPGFSRSGATIIGGLLTGCSYEVAAKFSFIIAVPTMCAAVGYDLLKSAPNLTQNDLILIAIGFVTSFITAMFAIVTFIKLLNRLKLTPFAIYRLALAGLSLLVI